MQPTSDRRWPHRGRPSRFDPTPSQPVGRLLRQAAADSIGDLHPMPGGSPIHRPRGSPLRPEFPQKRPENPRVHLVEGLDTASIRVHETVGLKVQQPLDSWYSLTATIQARGDHTMTSAAECRRAQHEVPRSLRRQITMGTGCLRVPRQSPNLRRDVATRLAGQGPGASRRAAPPDQHGAQERGRSDSSRRVPLLRSVALTSSCASDCA